MPGLGKVALVTGASRGIGYAIAKELSLRIPEATLKLTTRGTANLEGLASALRLDIGPLASSRCVYRRLELLDHKSVKKLAQAVTKKHGHINFIVNNAAVFNLRENSLDKDMLPVFYKESKELLGVNYYGLKCVVETFLPLMEDHSRIVNIGSHLGMIDCISGDEPAAGELRNIFTDPQLTEKDLDQLLNRFLESAKKGSLERDGWPQCAYSVSKVAVNAYTGILQRRLDKEMPDKQIVVNSVHTGAPHSKMKQGRESLIPREEGAAAVAYVATLGASEIRSPNLSPRICLEGEEDPRGKVLWHDLREIQWKADTVRPMAEDEKELMGGEKLGETKAEKSVKPLGELKEGDTMRLHNDEKREDTVRTVDMRESQPL